MSDRSLRSWIQEQVTEDQAGEFRHRLSRSLGPARVEEVCARQGLDYDATKLVTLNESHETAGTSRLSVGDAHQAFRSGKWTPGRCRLHEGRCARCGGALRNRASEGCVRGNCSVRPIPDGCGLCFGTGRRWSEHAASLAAYSGEASLVTLVEQRILPRPATWLDCLKTYSALAMLAAALGVARAWCDSFENNAEEGQVLDLVRAYVDHPDNENRDQLPEPGAPGQPGVITWLLCPVFGLGAPGSSPIEMVIQLSRWRLGEEEIESALRHGVRRWVLGVFDE